MFIREAFVVTHKKSVFIHVCGYIKCNTFDGNMTWQVMYWMNLWENSVDFLQIFKNIKKDLQ
jgi:hypothetical protein